MNYIKFLTIVPSNLDFCEYFINDEKNPHVLTYKEMSIFIFDHIGYEKRILVNELLDTFQDFLIDIENREVIELGVDREKELKCLKNNFEKTIDQIKLEMNKKLTPEETINIIGKRDLFN